MCCWKRPINGTIICVKAWTDAMDFQEARVSLNMKYFSSVYIFLQQRGKSEIQSWKVLKELGMLDSSIVHAHSAEQLQFVGWNNWTYLNLSAFYLIHFHIFRRSLHVVMSGHQKGCFGQSQGQGADGGGLRARAQPRSLSLCANAGNLHLWQHASAASVWELHLEAAAGRRPWRADYRLCMSS